MADNESMGNQKVERGSTLSNWIRGRIAKIRTELFGTYNLPSNMWFPNS